MKLQGFIGPAYTLDALPVDAQRCVNLYPEVIESGHGKGGQVAYFKETPGLEKILEVGDGPIRLIHVDSIGRIFVVSGNKVYTVGNRSDWKFIFSALEYSAAEVAQTNTDVNTTTNEVTLEDHGLVTGLKVQVTTIGVLPAPLAESTDYWIIKVDDDKFKFASSLENALSGSEIDLTDTGGSTMTVTPQVPDAQGNIKYDQIDFQNHTFFKKGHGFYDGLEVQFKASGGVPTGIFENTSYFICNATTDSFSLAETISEAESGTKIEFDDIDSDWTEKLVGSDGEYGGEPSNLATSIGPVKAASMSFGGDGSDSSTVFVDGVFNYLYLNGDSEDLFAPLGSLDSAQAVFNFDSDLIFSIKEDFQDYIDFDIRLSSLIDSELGEFDAYITVQKNATDIPGSILFDITIALKESGSLTTAELCEIINQGAQPSKEINIPGKNIALIDSADVLSIFECTGGDSQTVADGVGAGQRKTFSVDTNAHFGYGAVPGATQIKWSDGFFILNELGTNKFWVSDLQSFNVDTLSFASSEGSPDLVQALEVVNRYLYVLNELTTEVYANTGNVDFPFERVGGGFIEIGCMAPQSVAEIDGKICFLSQSKSGRGVIAVLSGLQHQRISTHAIEQAIKGYANPEKSVGYTYESGGHAYYVLNFDEATWVYDFSTRLWHERAYWNGTALERHRSNTHAFVPSKGIHLVGDYENSKLYILSDNHFFDDEADIKRIRSAPHLSHPDQNRIFYNNFQVDLDLGEKQSEDAASYVKLNWSNDGAKTWNSGRALELSPGQRAKWERLGSARTRTFQVEVVHPGKVSLIDAHIQIEGGTS